MNPVIFSRQTTYHGPKTGGPKTDKSTGFSFKSVKSNHLFVSYVILDESNEDENEVDLSNSTPIPKALRSLVLQTNADGVSQRLTVRMTKWKIEFMETSLFLDGRIQKESLNY